jgi:hypothetical protein
MARKTSRRVAASKRKKSPTRKGRKSPATKRVSGATAPRKAVSVEDFVRCIRTLHDLDLVRRFVRSAKRANLTLTMDTAAFEQVKKSVNKLRKRAPVSANIPSPASIGLATKGVKSSAGEDPFDFGSNSSLDGLGGVDPFSDEDPFDF